MGLTGGTVQWNGATTGITTQAGGTDITLTATIDPSLLIAGSAAIGVKTASATSNSVPFEVTSPTPTLTSLSPAMTPVETPNPATNVQIQLTGTNFANGAKVYFNRASNGITTTFNSSTSLTATLPASLLGPFGSTDDITVVNTPPGGGRSPNQSFRVVAPPPVNDNFANAIVINSLTIGDVRDSSGATTEATDPVPPCVAQATPAQGNTGGEPNGVYNTIWYAYTPQFSANLEVDTIGSSYDTVLSVWRATPGGLSLVGCNDDIQPGVYIQSQLIGLPLAAGATYYVMVSSFGPPDPNPIALGGRSVLNFSYNGGATPMPILDSLSPSSATSGGSQFVLTVNGHNFVNGATVVFGTSQEATTFVSSTQLTATIPASDLQLPGTVSVYAYNPPPTDGPSNSLVFTINLGTYPVPTLTSLYPPSVLAGSPAFTLQANGSDFAQTAVINFNGTAVRTTSNGPDILSGQIPASAIASAGTAQVTVTNPSPGGGTSSPLNFTIIQPNPIPTITSINPNSAPAGTQSNVMVTIIGTNFQQGISTLANYGSGYELLSTTFVNSTQLTAIFDSGMLKNAGTLTITVTDPYPGGTSNAVNFTVTAPPDFNLSPQIPSVTVTAGNTAMVPLNIGTISGFSGSVTVTCTVTAPQSTCSANPGMVNAGSSTTLTITTTARGVLTPSRLPRKLGPNPIFLFAALAMLLWTLLAFRFASLRGRRAGVMLPLAAFMLYLVLNAAGCGGGGGNSTVSGGQQQGTPAGNWVIVITGTSGANSHQITVPLTVN
jgi:hypothetical protein